MFKAVPSIIWLCQTVAFAGLPVLQVDVPRPQTLDLGAVDPLRLIPRDPRDPAQLEAARQAWEVLLAPYQGAQRVRLRLPDHPLRTALLLAASQALKAQHPDTQLLLAFDPHQPGLVDEAAWGGLDGGALLPEDLGPDPAQWEPRLVQAQGQLPGRPWTLWLDLDPGPLAGVLLGDRASLVVPAQGPAARLAQALPQGDLEVAGGLGDVTFTPASGPAQRWRYDRAAWNRVPAPPGAAAVLVVARESYDVGALIARMRAAQLRNRAALRTLEGTLRVELHLQQLSGPGEDIGFRYDLFHQAGEGDELVRRDSRVGGVKANLGPKSALPLVEPSVAAALPVALSLSERFRYSDGGPGAEGCRRIRFEPVDADPTLPRGELLVAEASGQILKEASHRDGLPGKVRSVDLTLEYGEVLPGIYQEVKATAFERWIMPDGVIQAQRRLVFEDLRPNQAGFEQRREAVRNSNDFMLKETVAGVRYFQKMATGGRVVEPPRSTFHAMTCGVLLPGTGMVAPFAALAGAHYDLGQRGIQVNYFTALVFNQASATIPNLLGCDLRLDSVVCALPIANLPVRRGRVLDQDGVANTFGHLNGSLSRDLGAGFRGGAEGRFQYDAYNAHSDRALYPTQGFLAPPDGWTREARAKLLWQKDGAQLAGFLGWGQRPPGSYGLPGALEAVPNGGRYRRWGITAGYDLVLPGKSQIHVEGGDLGGSGFDRFKSLDLADVGNATVGGISPYALSSEHASYGKLAYVLPPGANLRLTVGLEEAQVRALDDQQHYDFTSLALNGDLPGFWKITYVRVELGVGLHSGVAGARTVTGMIAMFRVF